MSDAGAIVGVGRLSIAELRRIFEENRRGVATLEVLSRELKKRSCDDGFDLLAEVASALVAARKAQPADLQHPAQALLSARQLSRPDARPLFRYRVTLSEWERLRHHLVQLRRTNAIERADERDAGAFAMYAAEWFRREFEGGAYRWEELLKSIGGVDPATTASLSRRGLRWWGRRAHRTDHGEQRLMSLALEGGFPTRLLESREQGWLAGALRRLIARTAALPDHSLEAVMELAATDPAIPSTFEKEEFFALLAELALAIVELRSEAGAEAVAAGIPTSAWLDAQREGWRDELPITLEGEGASKLIDELVSLSLERLSGAGARCWRMLVRSDGVWSPSLKLGFEGAVRLPPAVRQLASRLRVHAVGDLGDRLAGELALLEPPGEDGAWVARPRPAAPRRPLRNYSFSSPALVELRTDGVAVDRFAWSAAGEPLRGEVLAFTDDRDARPDAVEELTFLGGGSQRTRQSAIYVWAPLSHVATTAAGTQVPPLWEGDGRRLFRLTEPSFVTPPGDDLGYYYEPNSASGKTECLRLDGVELRFVTSSDGAEIFSGAPVVSLQSGVAKTPVRFGEVYWRYQLDRTWHDLKREPLGPGPVEIVWRSSEARAARDRRRLHIVPSDLVIRSRGLTDGAAEFWIEGGSGWRLEGDTTQDYTAMAVERGVRTTWSTSRRNSINLQLVCPQGRVCSVTLRYPLGDGAIVSPSGAVLSNGSTVTVRQLRGARAFASRRTVLAVESTNRDIRTVYRQAIEDECSLWSLRDRVASLMEASDELDAEVRLAFEPNGPGIRVRRYEYDLKVERNAVGFRKPPAKLDGALTLEWRSLIDMSERGLRFVGEIDPTDAPFDVPYPLPEDLVGPGVVYLCDGESTVSRPRFVRGAPLEGVELNGIQRAVAHEGHGFDAALKDALDRLQRGETDVAAELRWLHDLVKVSTRLPATTFNVLRAIGKRSGLLAHLIASSGTDDELERVWGLEPQLPFLWVLVSLDDWRAAFSAQHTRTFDALRAIGWEEAKAQATASAQAAATVQRLVQLDEDLRAPMVAAGLLPSSERRHRTAREIGQDRIRRLAGSEHERGRGTLFMSDPELRAQLERHGQWFVDFHEDHWDGVLAPVVAALRAVGAVTLLARQRLRIREAILEDPEHFSEAYEASLAYLSTTISPGPQR